jgi:hypothetical protein
MRKKNIRIEYMHSELQTKLINCKRAESLVIIAMHEKLLFWNSVINYEHWKCFQYSLTGAFVYRNNAYTKRREKRKFVFVFIAWSTVGRY